MDGQQMPCYLVMRAYNQGKPGGLGGGGGLASFSHVWVDEWEEEEMIVNGGGARAGASGRPEVAGAQVRITARNVGYFLTIQGQQNSPTQLSAPYVDDLRRRFTNIVKNPKCADFIKDLINRTATVDNPAEFDDAMTGFNLIHSQEGFIYGDTIKKAYGFDGHTIHGSISKGNAQIEFALPRKWLGPDNPKAIAGFVENQLAKQAVGALHELLHLAGKKWFDDFALAKSVAAMRGEKPPDYSGMNTRDAVRTASEYWDKALQLACEPK
jgi:hypothetical protein